MYYYKHRNVSEIRNLSDDYCDFLNGKTPYQLFVKENNINIWWHQNDFTGKIDRNINMADLNVRKSMAT